MLKTQERKHLTGPVGSDGPYLVHLAVAEIDRTLSHGRPEPTPVILCVVVSRAKGTGQGPKMFLVSHTKNLFIFSSEGVCASEPASNFSNGGLTRTPAYRLGMV